MAFEPNDENENHAATALEAEDVTEHAAPADAAVGETTDAADDDVVVAIDLDPSAELVDVIEVDEVDEVDEDDDGEAAAPAEPSPYDRPGRWYVVHSYAGYENKVKSNLANRVRSYHSEDQIFEV